MPPFAINYFILLSAGISRRCGDLPRVGLSQMLLSHWHLLTFSDMDLTCILLVFDLNQMFCTTVVIVLNFEKFKKLNELCRRAAQCPWRL